ncbi:unnamed protein product [Prunus armeniaca]|uniref:Uncharacterized protein n=1 Tax=Prunus armeniaca TaxID=36596 RepID=A0A6J5W1U9_PRUAR|nr:unnamed protein product [Prunus armeniaca]
MRGTGAGDCGVAGTWGFGVARTKGFGTRGFEATRTRGFGVAGTGRFRATRTGAGGGDCSSWKGEHQGGAVRLKENDALKASSTTIKLNPKSGNLLSKSVNLEAFSTHHHGNSDNFQGKKCKLLHWTGSG